MSINKFENSDDILGEITNLYFIETLKEEDKKSLFRLIERFRLHVLNDVEIAYTCQMEVLKSISKQQIQ